MPSPAAGHQPAFRDASFVITYSVLGSGKSVDQVAAFPRALVLSKSRELKSVMTTLGFSPHVEEVQTLYDVEYWVEGLLKARAQKDAGALAINAVILDDATVISYATEMALRSGKLVVSGRGAVKPTGWDLWTEQKNNALSYAITIAEKLKQAGLHFAVNGHMRPGRTNGAGKFIRGGIDLPTDLAESFPAPAELCALIQREDDRLFQPSVFVVKPMDSQWATKNRLLPGLPERFPANTGELLRAAGYVLPRPVGLEKHEEFVETLANYLNGGFGMNAMDKKALQPVLVGPTKNLMQFGLHPLHLRWVLRDGVDRAWFRQAQQRSVFAELGAL